GNYKNALETYKTYILYRDSIFSRSNAEKVADLELRYETEKKDKEISIQNAQLNQQTTQRNALLIGMGLLGVITLLIFRSQRVKSKANRQLRETEALKNRWLANVSHELKTPLTLVQAPLSKALDSTQLSEIDKNNLKVANRGVKQLNRLVTEILDLIRLDKGHLELQPATEDYADLVRVTSYAFESLAISRGTQLRVHAALSCWMYVDAHQLRKTIENLLTNALKFTKEGDTITVALTLEKEAVKLTVTDTGMGISEEDLPYLFDRFYQSQDPLKFRIGGTGIGLSLTKEIIKMHDGTISVACKEGQETTFTISLPVSLLREAPEDIAKAEEDTTVHLSTPTLGYQETVIELPKLLLVEDNDDMRNFLMNDLKTACKVTKALDGKDALEKLRGTTYDVIISDIMMPRMDGVALIQAVKNNPDWKKIPFIILTALSGEEDRLDILRTGVDDYITKPFSSEELKVRIQNLINNSKSRSDVVGDDEVEDSLLVSIEKDIKMHLADPDYSVKAMAEHVAMTERSLHRYLKKTTGLSPTGLITELKLQKAMQLLEKKSCRTLKEICSQIGYQRTSRFSIAFEKRFGKRPAEYL
ncbi:MAG: ATP-binding protein, partial [Bacteroidota bacterium]